MQHNFVTPEEVSQQQNNVKTLVRFIGTLTLLKKIIVPTTIVILCAAATPSYFLWFLGKVVDCTMQSGCQVTHDLLGWEVMLPLTTSSLLAIAVVAMFCRVAAWTMFELSGQWSTQEIQAQMMRSISGVRTSFFDENPSGRLINRLLGDYGMLRLEGVMSMGDTANSFADVICVGLLIMVANPLAGLLILPVILIYVGLQTQLAPMMSHARELRAVRIGEALHRKTDLIEGRTMFTLYNKVDNLLERIYKAFNNSMNIQLFYAKLMSWGMLWMGVISATYAVVVYAFLIAGIHNQTISVTVAAVVITAVFNLNNLFFGLSWDMSFLGETASHARRAFYIIDLPHETEQESLAPQIVDDAPQQPVNIPRPSRGLYV
jgi:ABC-type multidrug transport system fused ATPase/permease subunit